MSHHLLEAAAEDDVERIADFLKNKQEEYSNTVTPLYPGEQLEVLYTREYAFENADEIEDYDLDEMGESAEELLLSNNDQMLRKRFVQVYGGSLGALAGFRADDLKAANTFLRENGSELLTSGPDEILTAASVALAGGYALGKAYSLFQDNNVPLEVNGATTFNSDPLEELRKDLLTEYDVNTYCKDTQIPKYYHK